MHGAEPRVPGVVAYRLRWMSVQIGRMRESVPPVREALGAVKGATGFKWEIYDSWDSGGRLRSFSSLLCAGV